MVEPSRIFPAIGALGLTFVPDDDDWAWEALFQPHPTHDSTGTADPRPMPTAKQERDAAVAGAGLSRGTRMQS